MIQPPPSARGHRPSPTPAEATDREANDPSATDPPAAGAVATLPVVVVGAGPAGLAVAGELARRGVRPTVVEAGAAPAWAWRHHYPWLRLHTTRRDSALPGLPAPAGPGRYPTRDELTDHLDAHAARLDADLRLGHRVVRLRPGGDGEDGDREGPGAAPWSVELDDGGRLRARHVVVATGFNRRPVRPELPGEADFGGPVLHASRWRDLVAGLGGEVAAERDGVERPRGLAGRRILVVGLGNSGADLSAALAAAGAEVVVAVRGPVHLVPLEVLGINWRTWHRLLPGAAYPLGRLCGAGLRRWLLRRAAGIWCRVQRRRFGDLEERGLRLGRPDELVGHWHAARPPLTAGPFVALLRRGGITVVPALTGFEPGAARLAGTPPRRHRCDAVLLATGYRPALDELLPPAPDAARPAAPAPSADGRHGPRPGLWLCGYQPELIRIRRSARRVARAIAADLGA